MSDIQETIDRLRELNQTASPAPWRIVKYNGYEDYGENQREIHSIRSVREIVAEQLGCHACDVGLQSDRIENFEYIVQTRNALPDVIAEIDRLGTRLAIAEARLGRVATSHPDAYLAALEGDKE